jgi:hypothetical protein
MSNETPAAIDPDMFAAVFSENWDSARYIKSERISFMNAYSVICAGVLALLQSVQAKRPSLKGDAQMKRKNLGQSNATKSRKWFQRRRRWHDPMLVFNMSIFSSLLQRENVWS